jgi:hypothetical protein
MRRNPRPLVALRRLLVVSVLLAAGCQAVTRTAKLIVEADGIGHDFKQLNRAVDAEVAAHSAPDR